MERRGGKGGGEGHVGQGRSLLIESMGRRRKNGLWARAGRGRDEDAVSQSVQASKQASSQARHRR